MFKVRKLCVRIYTNKKEDIIQYWGNFTDIFKDIFGNIVKSAKILLMEDYGNNTVSKNDVKKVAENIEKQYNKCKILHCDGMEVVITFQNGKIVEFCNSEWASIRNLKEN